MSTIFICCRHHQKNLKCQILAMPFTSKDSSTRQPITSARRLHGYCLFAWSHLGCLGCLFILGGFAAFALIYLLCLPLSSSSYYNSASWTLRKILTTSSTEKSSSEQHTCFTEGNCVTAVDSAGILSFHLRHVYVMVDLVEEAGLPPGDYFDFDSRRVDFNPFHRTRLTNHALKQPFP
ncbi:uncharacterized protein EV420DRAFT_539802 [Desarmillaria tabescens]|uniref:Uncharacterized protein n=1 Tax=Armillaria tabescens TaxID=1929756 RepID=A0AA39KC42_ARMTA|nr:uncharacterized protein EV420DRAFT_539802 [Desarmillaria tabescens]KAK0457104.1 hypothetical protein EV420DRAFT_539802 [Desarmillaria tabescens]